MGRLADPQGRGPPERVPGWPRSAIVLNISSSLDSQTTSKSDETKSITSVIKIASQRFKNHVDTTSVLREKPQKPKETGQKTSIDGAKRGPRDPPRLPPREPDHGSSANGRSLLSKCPGVG